GAEDQGQPRGGRAEAARQPDLRPPRGVRRRAECESLVRARRDPATASLRSHGRRLAAGALAAGALAAAATARCRERPSVVEDHASSGPTPAASGTATRVLYPSAPGSFVDLVSGARSGVVAIRAGAPVKSGPAAIFPGTPESTADVALGTGFLIEAK